MPYARPLIAYAFDYLFAEESKAHFAQALLNALLDTFFDEKIDTLGAIDRYVSEGYFMQTGCTNDPVLYYAKSVNGRQIAIQLNLQKLFLGVTKCSLVVNDRLKNQLEHSALLSKDADLYFICLSTFGITNEQATVTKTVSDKNRNNRYNFLWMDLTKSVHKTENKYSELEQWLYLITYAQDHKTVPNHIITSEIVQRAFEELRISKMSALNKKWYQKHLNDEPERLSTLKNSTVTLDERYIEVAATYARLNTNMLYSGIGIYPVQQIEPIQINTSAYISAQKTAFDLFRAWSKLFKEIQGTPVTIKDESKLVANFQTVIQESLVLVYKEDSFIRSGLRPDAGIDLLIGIIEVKISQLWYFEYVLKNHNAFKSTMALNAILTHFEVSGTSQTEIEHLYEAFFDASSNQADISKHVEIDKIAHQIKPIISPKNTPGQVAKVLENMRAKSIEEISHLTRNVPICLKNTDALFEPTELSNFIAQNKVLFAGNLVFE
jgi:PD-(D/E)XK nuclease family transposase